MTPRLAYFWIAVLFLWTVGLFIPLDERTRGPQHDEPQTLYLGEVYETLWDKLSGRRQDEGIGMVYCLLIAVGHCLTCYFLVAVPLRLWDNLRSSATSNRLGYPGFGGAIPVPWYDQEQYGRLLELAADRDLLEPTFEAWQARAESLLGTLQAGGMKFEKIRVNVQNLASWCQSQGRPLDAEARTQYARRAVVG